MSSISDDDDDSGPSLKELVTKNLETNGILGKLQAQLRASIFLILEEEFQEKNIPIVNQRSSQLLSTNLGKVAISLIQDFLQCLNLEFTLAVFCPETKSVLMENSSIRENLSKEFGSKPKDNYPFLLQLIEDSQNAQNENVKVNMFDSGGSSKIDKSFKNPSNEEGHPEKNQDSNSLLNKTTTNHVNLATSCDTNNIVKITENPTTVKENLPSEKEESLRKSESIENRSTTKESSYHSTINSDTNYSSNGKSVSSTSNNTSGTESSDNSTTKSSQSNKRTLSGIDKYEDEFSSSSDTKIQTEENSNTTKNESEVIKNHSKMEEEKSEIEEALETAEDIEEDISSLDDLLSTNSENSNKTKDISASKEEKIIPDYEESL